MRLHTGRPISTSRSRSSGCWRRAGSQPNEPLGNIGHPTNWLATHVTSLCHGVLFRLLRRKFSGCRQRPVLGDHGEPEDHEKQNVYGGNEDSHGCGRKGCKRRDDRKGNERIGCWRRCRKGIERRRCGKATIIMTIRNFLQQATCVTRKIGRKFDPVSGQHSNALKSTPSTNDSNRFRCYHTAREIVVERDSFENLRKRCNRIR